MVRLWGELESIESDHGLSFISEPDFGFAWAAFRWAKGHTLDSVLRDGAGGAELAAGDFVRWIKQLLDLLGQVATRPGERDDGAADARPTPPVDALRRGVVAYSSVG